MDELLNNLTSINWWVGVFVVGITINLVAAYSKPYLDGLLSRFSTRWATRTATKRQERESRILALMASEHEQLLNRMEELRLHIRSFLSILQATVSSGLAILLLTSPILPKNWQRVLSALLLLWALLLFLLSANLFWEAERKQAELNAARARLSSQTANGPKIEEIQSTAAEEEFRRG